MNALSEFCEYRNVSTRLSDRITNWCVGDARDASPEHQMLLPPAELCLFWRLGPRFTVFLCCLTVFPCCLTAYPCCLTALPHRRIAAVYPNGRVFDENEILQYLPIDIRTELM